MALYVSTFSLLALLFQVINIAYPDPLFSRYIDPYSSGIRWAIASLIIIFPLYLLLSWILQRDYRLVPEKRNLGIRRWLVFITLFFTGAAIVIDLVVLINSFLGGEITTRFFMKIFAVLVVAGFIFGYYLWDLRRSTEHQTKLPKFFAGIAAVLVVGSIIGGFLIMGSPAKQRQLRYDAEKVTDLNEIQWRVISSWQAKKTLPANLEVLNDSISGFSVPVDPQTGQSYEYRATSAFMFELCANFNRQNADDQTNYAEPYYPAMNDKSLAYGMENSNWQHAAGRQCFTRTIDPEMYRAQ